MADISTNIKISEEVQNLTASLYEKIAELEDIVTQVTDKIVTLSLDPSNLDLCSLKDTIAGYESVASDISELATKAAQITAEFEEAVSKYSEMVYMYAAEIVLKAISIIELRVKVLGLNIEKEIANLSKEAFARMLNGESSTAIAIVLPQLTLMSNVATGVSAVLSILGTLLSLIQNIFPMSVASAGMSLFPTPKSLTAVKMNVTNLGQSICNTLGPEIEVMLSNIERGLDVSEKAEKIAKVGTGAAAGAVSVMTDDGISIGNLGKFKVMSRDEILTAINTIILSMGMAEPLPRYEKLSIINIRFMLWLITGFVPAGHTAFGIPGMP